MKNQQFQQTNFQEKIKTHPQEIKSVICKKCNATIEAGLLFCTECGEKINGEERTCPICNVTSTSEYCSNCGYKLIPTNCPKCGTETHEEFCEKCGEILTPQLKFKIEQKKVAENKNIEKASPEIIKKYQKLENEKKSLEEETFIKKMQEHQILLEEKGYFNNRENRIIKKFGINIFGTKLLDPMETTYATKIYNSLKSSINERQLKLETEEQQRLFPEIYKKQLDEEKYNKELEENYAVELKVKLEELEKKYKVALEKVTEEFNVSYEKEQERIRVEEERIRKEQEEKRRREEERIRRELEKQRRIEEERIRKEQEEKRRQEEEQRRREEAEYIRLCQQQMEKRILGRYICQYNLHFIEIEERDDDVIYGYYGDIEGTSVVYFKGVVYGDKFDIFAKNLVRGQLYDKYLSGQFTSDGNLLEQTGFCNESLFFKF